MNVMGIIFANDGSIGSLTAKRTTAAVPFAGRYRQVDFALSNLTCAGVRHIGIISRHNYQSLMHHIGSGEEWGLELREGGLEFLTPFAMSTTDNYRGKLETLYSAMDFLRVGPDDEYVVMTGSAILSNLDLSKVLAHHVASGKDLTMVTKAGIADGSRRLDLAVKLDETGAIADMAVDFAAPADYLASMDVFVVSKKWLMDQVNDHIAHNRYHMDRDLVLGGWQKGEVSVNVYQFDGIAMYNESIEDYFHSSMALMEGQTRHDIFGGAHPVYTKVRDRVPCYYGEDAHLDNCLVADGCMLEGHVADSVLFRQVSVGAGVQMDHCVIMNDCVIGEGAQLRYVIADKDVTISAGAQVMGTAEHPVVIQKGATV